LHFVRRSASIGPSAYAATWRDYARDLEQSLSGTLSRHVLNHVVAPAPPGYGFDGVHELWCESSQDAAAIAADIDRLRPKVTEWQSSSTGVVLSAESILRWP
jgi:hypothetical protein